MPGILTVTTSSGFTAMERAEDCAIIAGFATIVIELLIQIIIKAPSISFRGCLPVLSVTNTIHSLCPSGSVSIAIVLKSHRVAIRRGS